MKTVYKYMVNQTMWIEVPKDAKILTAQVQQGNICLWVEVETENEMVLQMIYVVATGGSIPPAKTYVGTVQLAEGMYVVHIYH